MNQIFRPKRIFTQETFSYLRSKCPENKELARCKLLISGFAFFSIRSRAGHHGDDKRFTPESANRVISIA